TAESDRPGEDLPVPEAASAAAEEAPRDDGDRRFHAPGRTVNGPSGAFPVPSSESLGGVTDLPEPMDVRPLEHIQRAESAVRQLQQEFRPPAAKTEVELIFEDWGNPFEEEFQQVIPVTGGPMRDTAAQPRGEGRLARTLPDVEAEEATADAGSLEVLIAAEGDETMPTVRAAPLGKDAPRDPEPEDAGAGESLILDAYAGTERTEDAAENGRREVGRAVRTPKFRRLFSQLKQRAAEGGPSR
ncbi:MAG: hypothetical protein GYA33_07970, partial [Thermogutta sp.]|nr:hypothetical protein [Thermogutta sp.]